MVRKSARILIEGLHYNDQTKEMYYQKGNSAKVVCAEWKSKKILWWENWGFHPTDHCRWMTEVTVDKSGWRHKKFYFVVNE